MPTTPPCPLPTKIPLEPKTQIKELKKKKKTTRSLPHPTHLNPKDKNQSMPHCKTHTKPRSAKAQNPDRRNHLTRGATRSTPPTSHHIQPIISDLERSIIGDIGNPPISTKKATNLHRSIPTPIVRSSRLSLHQSPPHVHHDPLHSDTLQRLQTCVHRFPPIHHVVHCHAIQRHHHEEIGSCCFKHQRSTRTQRQ